ncbi:MAG TPA: glycine cleavage T C-terminal barrel domain-containing protein [Candidatus Polarisedimenticolia bacterium]|nr:glycine cleavage T C-terminal barrel domain-containing protein [Candidatus Polarisedimenticolia bacterium]
MTAAGGSVAGGEASRGRDSDLSLQYRAAHAHAILVDRSALGRLAFQGKDSLDLLHRLTTNSIKTLKAGEGVAAVFATPKGRILDLVTFYLTEERLLCLTGAGRVAAIRDWIERYTFREEVRVEDLSESHGTLGLFGASAASVVAGLFGEETARRPLHAPSVVEAGGARAILASTYPLAGGGFHLTAAARTLPAIRERILGVPGVTGAGEECLEVLRIEAGRPAAGRELTEEYNPWEARLDDAISLSKGCYVGQEVVARLNTYRKVSKRLVRLAIPGDALPPSGAILARGGETTGLLTSSASVPGEGRVVALGYVRDEDAAVGGEIEVRWPEGGTGRATIVDGSR